MTARLKALFDAGFFTPLEYHFAISLGRMAGTAPEEVLLAAALMLHQTELGHICLRLSDWAGKKVRSSEGKAFADLRWPALTSWRSALDASPLVSDGERPAPLVSDDSQRLYLRRYWRFERTLAEWISARSADVIDDLDRVTLRQGLARLYPGEHDADEARAAVQTALEKRFAVITGGPGTGKTTIVLGILALLAMQWQATRGRLPNIIALAPTGKAAQRLGEVMSRMAPSIAASPAITAALPKTAMTIHRLLGQYPDYRDAGGTKEPALVPADVVVLDEASMVDLALMHALVRKLRSSARLILLGDKDQLSAVAAGSVMADICDAALIPTSAVAASTARLTTSYRFDDHSGIGRLAKAINEGDADTAVEILKTDPSCQVRFVPVAERALVRRALTPLAVRYYGEALTATTPPESMARFSTFRILTAHRAGDTGQTGINRFVESLLEKRGILALKAAWYDGRPVMITRNDYQLGLFNGDIGLTRRDPKTDRLEVFFTDGDGALVPVPPIRLRIVDTAFAMTVHRSQGSEFDHVAVVLPDRPSPITTRELLYTACTRARKQLTVIGTEAVIRHAVRTPTERSSGLKDRLIQTSSTGIEKKEKATTLETPS